MATQARQAYHRLLVYANNEEQQNNLEVKFGLSLLLKSYLVATRTKEDFFFFGRDESVPKHLLTQSTFGLWVMNVLFPVSFDVSRAVKNLICFLPDW